MYQAMDSRDRRFDGRFFVAVKTTGVYCRPICPAPTPKRRNTTFYRLAAVAELAGFRPCRRCRPEVSPDSPEWDTRADLVGRGLRLVAEGVVDEAGVKGLAERLGVSDRHLQRAFKNDLGATPGAIARSRRARLARQLLTETPMPITSVAFASGFASVRTFNETIKQIYRLTPTEMRRGGRAEGPAIDLALGFRPPLAAEVLLKYLAWRAIPGVEEVSGGSYRRTLRFGDQGAVVELTPTSDAVTLRLETSSIDHLAPVIQRARRLMDLDADPEVIDRRLASSPTLKASVLETPGIRLPGSFDPFESAVLAILQQGSRMSAAARAAGRLARAHGEALADPASGLTHLFPSPRRMASADLADGHLAESKTSAIRDLARRVSSGRLALDGSMDPVEARRLLSSIDGIGPTTVERIAGVSLRDPDALVAPGRLEGWVSPERARSLAMAEISDGWRPWRGYAAMRIWAVWDEGRVVRPSRTPDPAGSAVSTGTR